MRLAIIENGVVTRVVEAASFEVEPQGIVCDDTVQAGQLYNAETNTFARPLETARADKVAQIEARFAAALAGTVKYGGTDWEASTLERDLLAATVAAGGTLPTVWEDASGTDIEVNVTALLAAILAEHKQLQRKRRRLLRRTANADTVGALDLINW